MLRCGKIELTNLVHKEYKMRFYENPKKTSENREKARCYYIPRGVAKYVSLNGEWKFAFFENSDVTEEPKGWDKINVPSLSGFSDDVWRRI